MKHFRLSILLSMGMLLLFLPSNLQANSPDGMGISAQSAQQQLRPRGHELSPEAVSNMPKPYIINKSQRVKKKGPFEKVREIKKMLKTHNKTMGIYALVMLLLAIISSILTILLVFTVVLSTIFFVLSFIFGILFLVFGIIWLFGLIEDF